MDMCIIHHIPPGLILSDVPATHYKNTQNHFTYEFSQVMSVASVFAWLLFTHYQPSRIYIRTANIFLSIRARDVTCVFF